MKAIDILKQLSLEKKKEKHPTLDIKYIPLTKYSDKTANGLTKCIKDFLNLSGHQCERINTMGVFVPDKIKSHGHLRPEIIKGYYRKGTGTRGSADLSSTISINIAGRIVGISVKWEVKIGKDRLSPDQIAYGEKIKAAGGQYYVVGSFEEFYKYYLEIVK